MKIVIAPDSFKETLSAFEVASAIELGFQNVFPEAEIIKIPIAAVSYTHLTLPTIYSV